MPPKKGKGKKPKPAKHPKPGEKLVIAPAAVGVDGATGMEWKAHPDGGVAEGREFLAMITADGLTDVGVCLEEFYINPAEFSGTRLALKAQEFQKFKFRELDFEFVPALGSEERGSLVFSYDRDISNPTPPPTEAGLRQFLAFQDAKYGNVWTAHQVKCPLQDAKKQDLLFCQPAIGGDDRLSYQGQFYVSVMAPNSLTDGDTIGSIIVKYKCEFSSPALLEELDGVQAGSAATVPAATSEDFYEVVSVTPDTSLGDPSLLPKNFGDGTFGLLLREGLYRLTNWLFNPTFTGAGLIEFQPPQVELLEPSPTSAAPAAVVDQILSTPGDGDGGVPVSDYYVSVPRGGARIRQNVTTTSTLALTGGVLLYNAIKLAGYLGQIAGVISLTREKRLLLATKVAELVAARPASGEPRRTIPWPEGWLEGEKTLKVTRRQLRSGKTAPPCVGRCLVDSVDSKCAACSVLWASLVAKFPGLQVKKEVSIPSNALSVAAAAGPAVVHNFRR